jgi:hypothetical protein
VQPATASEAWGLRVVAGSPLVVEGYRRRGQMYIPQDPEDIQEFLKPLVEGFRDGSHLEEPDTSYGLYAIGHEGGVLIGVLRDTLAREEA